MLRTVVGPTRSAAPIIGLIAALGLVAVASLALGTREIPVSDVLTVLRSVVTGSALPDDPGLGESAAVIESQRIPRTILALVVGAALGMAGVVIQALTRNPLADPGLLGVSSGAALAVVSSITFLGATAVSETIWAGFLGAGLTSLLVFGIAGAGTVRGRTDPLGLVLAGAAVSAGLSAAVGVVVLRSPDALAAFRQWTVGSLVGRDLDSVLAVLPFLLGGILFAALLGPALDAIVLGDDVAGALGARPGTVRALGLIAVTILTGAATAACGPLAFIGLVIPHLARAIAGQSHRVVLPVAALSGALLLGVADILGRLVARPAEVQVGILLAVIGAPALLWLAMRIRTEA